MFREISQSQLSKLRYDLLLKQHNKCMICRCDLPSGNDVGCVDHQHLFKSDELGVHGNGLIRGVLCRDCNSLEGKIWNAMHRYGKAKSDNPVQSRVEWLRLLLEYYDDNLIHYDPILHPKEKRADVLSKSHYNRLIKYYKTLKTSYKRNGELKEVPKYTGRWTSKLKELDEQIKKSSFLKDDF